MTKEEKQAAELAQKSDTVVIDAIKELTKAVTELAERFKSLEKEWERWRKAGKF